MADGFPESSEVSYSSNSNFLRIDEISIPCSFKVMTISIVVSFSACSKITILSVTESASFLNSSSCVLAILPATATVYFVSSKSLRSISIFFSLFATLRALLSSLFSASSAASFSSIGFVCPSISPRIDSACFIKASVSKSSTSFFSGTSGLNMLITLARIPPSFLSADFKKSAIPVAFI